MPMGMSVDMFGKSDVLKDFCEIPELNAIINMKARMFATGALKLVNKKGKELTDHPISKMLKSPNWLQDNREFMRQTKLFRDIFGNEYVYKLKPVGLPVSRLFSIPPNMMKVDYNPTGLWFQQFNMPVDDIKYAYTQDGTQYNLSALDIIHMNDNRVSFDKFDKSFLEGQSKMEALQPVRRNLRLTYETLGVLLANRGAMGILSNASADGIGASIAVESDDKKEIQDAYKANYGGLFNQNQLIITSANLKWQQMGINPDKLGVFKGKAEDFAKCQDSYGMPGELFARAEGATYENQRQARKGAYQDTVIPEAQEWAQTLTEELCVNPDGTRDESMSIVCDYTHLPIFQEDLKQRGESLQTVTNALSAQLQDRAITIEEYQDELRRFGQVIHSVRPSETDTDTSTATTPSDQKAIADGALAVQAAVNSGACTYDTGLSILTIIYGFSEADARALITKPKEANEQEQTGSESQGEADPTTETEGNAGVAG